MMSNFASIVSPRATTSKAVAAPQTSVINSRRRIASSTVQDEVAAQTSVLEDIRFASKANICSASTNVRFTPESVHVRCSWGCPLRAKSELSRCNNVRRFTAHSASGRYHADYWPFPLNQSACGHRVRSTRISISLRSVPKSIGLVRSARAPSSKPKLHHRHEPNAPSEVTTTIAAHCDRPFRR
jgi:hypothetical protein